jgi:hypothetical protein
MRILKHIAVFIACVGLVSLFCFWAVSMSMETFVPGGEPLTFTKSELRNSAIGDACLSVLYYPTKLLRLEGSGLGFVFDILIYAILLYIAVCIIFALRRRARNAA